LVQKLLNSEQIRKTWPALRVHVLLLAASWTGFSILLGLLGAFDLMEIGGKEAVTTAIFHALRTSLVVMVTGLLIGAVPVGFLIKRLNAQA
jgi:hypothetical protein